MKNVLKEKFKNNMLVKPLYRKLRQGNKIKPKILIVDSTFKLDGNGISVKRNIVKDNREVFGRKKCKSKENRIFFCGSSGNNKKCFDYVNRIHVRSGFIKDGNMLCGLENRKPNICELEFIKNTSNKLVQSDNQIVFVHTVPNTWLRLYPLPKHPGESTWSVIFRCIVCQFGLCSLLILWTFFWVFVIHYFEGPYEIKVSLDFERQQNLLVIDLATELRQITPLSPRWRSAIEQRIQDERHLTMQAVSRGARVHPGQFWDLSGTFLVTVYIMTALGFGAPVPQTSEGRTCALIYAMLAVPTHVYLMLQASMCIVVKMETCRRKLKCGHQEKRPFAIETLSTHTENAFQNESPNCSRCSEVLKTPNKGSIGKKIMCSLSVFGACRSVPLAAILYYVFGAVVFGLARGRSAQDIAMFPIEFTTSGGLDSVEGYVRILYGIYVEGAMILLSCGLAALRRHSGHAVTCMTEKYKLFETEELN